MLSFHNPKHNSYKYNIIVRGIFEILAGFWQAVSFLYFDSEDVWNYLLFHKPRL